MVVNRIILSYPKDAHSLIPGTCEHVILHGEKDFVNVIELMNLISRAYPRLFRWARCNRKGL